MASRAHREDIRNWRHCFGLQSQYGNSRATNAFFLVVLERGTVFARALFNGFLDISAYQDLLGGVLGKLEEEEGKKSLSGLRLGGFYKWTRLKQSILGQVHRLKLEDVSMKCLFTKQALLC